jgi:cation transport regulator ChaC
MNTTQALKYFAYGSNLVLAEIRRSCPNAAPMCGARLPDFALTFPRKSTARNCGVASIEARNGSDVWGGVYEVPPSEWPALETREGYKPNRRSSFNSYAPKDVTVFVDGDFARPLNVITFVANPQANPRLPSNDYKNLIIAGAREWNLNAEYIARLEQIQTSKS